MDLRLGMVLNRSTDRRRRLLVDSSSPAGEATTQPHSATGSTGSVDAGMLDVRRSYAIGAHRRHQRKVIDLIPKRPLAYSAAIGILAVLLVGVNLLAYFAPSWNSIIGQDGIASLALTGPQSITTWLATIFFAITAGLCLQIYALRQHRSDDYEGSYRIWAWLSITLAVTSLACVVPITSIAQNVFSAVSGREFATSWLPAAIGITFASLLLVRYLMEVRASYGTVAWAGLAWLAISLRVSSPEMLASIFPQSTDQDYAFSLVWGNGLLVAAAATLLANLTYGRFVFLRANGFIASKPKSIEQATTSRSVSLRERFATRRASRKQAAQVKRAQRQAAKVTAAELAAATVAAAPAPKDKTPTVKKSIAPAKPAKQKRKKQSPATATEPIETSATPKKQTQAKPQKAQRSTPASPEPEILKMSSRIEPAVDASASKSISDSASAKLKQLADAARAKKNASEGTDEASMDGNQKLSKAERRRERKLQRQQKRAA